MGEKDVVIPAYTDKELIVKAVAGVKADFGRLTIPANVFTRKVVINHSLGCIPSEIYMFPDNDINYPTGDSGYSNNWGAAAVHNDIIFGLLTYSSYAGNTYVHKAATQMYVEKTSTKITLTLLDTDRRGYGFYSGNWAWLALA